MPEELRLVIARSLGGGGCKFSRPILIRCPYQGKISIVSRQQHEADIMSGVEIAQGIDYAKSTLIALVEAKERYELIEGIAKDAPYYRQRLSDLENVLGQVHRVFSDSLNILNANKEMRQSLVRALRNCRDPISEINKKLMSINAKRTRPQRLYKASEWNVKLAQHHIKLDSAKLTLLIADEHYQHGHDEVQPHPPCTDRVMDTLTIFQHAGDVARTRWSSALAIEVYELLWWLVR